MTADAVVAPEAPVEEPDDLENFGATLAGVFTKESRWRMRGRRAFVVVTAYVGLLGLLVIAAYQLVYDSARFGGSFDGSLPPPDLVSASSSATIGQLIYLAILVVQTLLTLLVAPALTSGAIAMEREKQTLELLITTPMSTLGMIVGKLISSLAFLLLLILGSLPLMSVVFIFGGVAPEDVVRAYVLLLVVAFGTGAIGLFMSALVKRTQVATALSYVVVFTFALVAPIVHTYLLATSQRFDDNGVIVRQRTAPEAIIWLSPLAADIDLGCTAIPETFSFACSYVSAVTGQDTNAVVAPPRDALWPKSVVALLTLGIVLTLLTTQLIAPSRRKRWRQIGPSERRTGSSLGADPID